MGSNKLSRELNSKKALIGTFALSAGLMFEFAVERSLYKFLEAYEGKIALFCDKVPCENIDANADSSSSSKITAYESNSVIEP